MLLVVLSVLVVTLASAQFPFAPQFTAYPGNYYQQLQHQYQDNRGILQSIQNAIIPSAFIKTTTVNSTVTATATCTVSVADACSGRRDIDEVVEQFAPAKVNPTEASVLPEMERDARQAQNYYYQQDFPQHQPLQSTFDEPNTYETPYFPSYQHHGQVAARQLYISTLIKTNWIGVVATTRVTPTCYNATASLFQCP